MRSTPVWRAVRRPTSGSSSARRSSVVGSCSWSGAAWSGLGPRRARGRPPGLTREPSTAPAAGGSPCSVLSLVTVALAAASWSAGSGWSTGARRPVTGPADAAGRRAAVPRRAGGADPGRRGPRTAGPSGAARGPSGPAGGAAAARRRTRSYPIGAPGGVLTPPSDPQTWAGGTAVRCRARRHGGALITGHTVHTGGGAFDDLETLRAGDQLRVRTGEGRRSGTS